MSAPAAAGTAAADGYARIRAGRPAAVRGTAAVVWVEGPDAATFLQGLLTNDVAGLAQGSACRALVLDAKGHVLDDMRVHRDGPEAFTLVVAPEHGGAVAALLERYHFSEDLELIGPEPVETVTFAGVAPPAGAGVAVPGPVPGTVEIVADDPVAAVAACGAPEAPAEALEMARVAAGSARVGVDTAESTLVQEAALEDAVSFTKGCYLGQETVARLQFRGRANRRLRGLRLPSPPPAAGAAVTIDGREVGRLTSVAATPDLGPIGLAILRREVGEGGIVEIEGCERPGRVVPLPFGRR